MDGARHGAGLYVHVPFCVRKCLYCAFYSVPANSELMERYVAALLEEMQLAADCAGPIETVYFGGGTPSLLDCHIWERIFKAMDRHGWLTASEWTVECNPATLAPDKAKLLRERGVNRISLGVQSLDDGLLRRLGRVHTRQMALDTFDVARKAGFSNVGVDLMFGIPGQSMEGWLRTLTEAIDLGCEHLSCYEVTYEDGTPMFDDLKAGRIDVDEDLVCDMYDELVSTAARNGLEQYEVSNFARSAGAVLRECPRFACRHNINYWRGGQYLGLGPSAASYTGRVRSNNTADVLRYCEQVESGKRPVAFSEALSPLARAGELAAIGLRMNAGWPFDQFHQLTGYDLRCEWAGEMQDLDRQGMGRMLEDRFQLTQEGLRFADYAAQLFLRPEYSGAAIDGGDR